jgi:hypothetical protein
VLAGTVSLPVDGVQEPRLLSFRNAVAEIGTAAGRDIGFVSVPIEDFTAKLTEYGLPQDFIWLLNHLFTEVLGSKVQLADGVRLRPRDRCDGRVDPLNLGERISV